jgi:hypothetical protein
MAHHEETCVDYVVANAKNVVFKPIIMVEITDPRILQHLEN